MIAGAAAAAFPLILGAVFLVVGAASLRSMVAGRGGGRPPGGGGGGGTGGMMPHATVSSNGLIYVAGTTPYTAAPSPDTVTTVAGPLTVQETGQKFLRLTRPVRLVDAVCSTSAGATTTNLHALRIFIQNVGAGRVTIYSNMIAPGAAQRHPPNVVLPAGVDIYFQEYQLSGGAAEVNVWTLDFA